MEPVLASHATGTVPEATSENSRAPGLPTKHGPQPGYKVRSFHWLLSFTNSLGLTERRIIVYIICIYYKGYINQDQPKEETCRVMSGRVPGALLTSFIFITIIEATKPFGVESPGHQGTGGGWELVVSVNSLKTNQQTWAQLSFFFFFFLNLRHKQYIAF